VCKVTCRMSPELETVCVLTQLSHNAELMLRGVLILGKQRDTLLCACVNEVKFRDDSYRSLAAFIEGSGFLDNRYYY
jgi:hypothetical protein